MLRHFSGNSKEVTFQKLALQFSTLNNPQLSLSDMLASIKKSITNRSVTSSKQARKNVFK